MYLHQHSRLDWIKYGDSNSSFFHATVTQRKQIVNSNGVWLEDEEEIDNHLQSFFSHLFQSSGLRDFHEVLCIMEKRITDEMNDRLIMRVTDEEIKTATSQ